MSSGLAIAAITAVFKNLLEDGLVQNSALSSMGNVLVTTLPPDQISIGVDGQPQLNLFLYQVSQNRKADLGGSDRNHPTHLQENLLDIENPPLAINLHYLLTAYGNKDFQTEMLLGSVMQLMHQVPVLSNDTIRVALNHVSSTNRTGLLSQAIESTSVTALTEQLGQVQITPNLFDIEQMSRLWSLLQSSYRPSIAYEVSMVFIGSKKPLSSSHFSPIASEQPYIDKVVASPLGRDVIITGSSLILYGKNLTGEITRLRLNDENNLLEPEILEERRLLFKLPQTLSAGIQQVQVIHQQKYKLLNRQEVKSNQQTFLLHPTITASWQEKESTLPSQQEQATSTEKVLTVWFNPRILQQQVVMLRLTPIHESGGKVHIFEAPLRDVDIDHIQISINDVPSGIYIVQAKVDGAESSAREEQAKNLIDLTNDR